MRNDEPFNSVIFNHLRLHLLCVQEKNKEKKMEKEWRKKGKNVTEETEMGQRRQRNKKEGRK